MILKEADDRSVEIEKLREWSQDERIPEEVREKLETELRIRLAGLKGEGRAAYEIDFHFGNRADWVVIHDLRLEVNGRTAQIDHLLINRALHAYVIETKNYAEGFSINERDEFTIFTQGRPRGIDSPHEQNKKHIAVLREAFDSGAVPLPKRPGLSLRPQLINLILVSPKARTRVPERNESQWRHVVKADAIKSWIEKRVDSTGALEVLSWAAKMVAPETVQELGRAIVSLHQPAEVNPYKIVERFGLSRYLSQQVAPAPTPKPIVASKPEVMAEMVEESTPCCQGCGATVEPKVVSFCRLPQSVQKFGGKILCRECQSAPAKPAAEAKPEAPSKASGHRCAACDAALEDKVVFFCRLPAQKQKFGGKLLCRTCQPK